MTMGVVFDGSKRFANGGEKVKLRGGDVCFFSVKKNFLVGS